MSVKIKKDNRSGLWKKLEKEIASRAGQKDKNFALSGKWKKFIRKQDGYKVFFVDGRWIRNNLCVYFGHGGHGLVHEFIPMDEIWVGSHHRHEGTSEFSLCGCKLKRRGQKLSKNYFNSTVIHEITECEQMKKGEKFWESHHAALRKEKEAGLLQDPFKDT